MSVEKTRSKKRKANSLLGKGERNQAEEVNGGLVGAMIGPGDQSSSSSRIQFMDELTHTKKANNNSVEEKDENGQKSSSSDIKGNKPSSSNNPYDNMRHVIVTNDGKHENLVRLVGLKNLFSKQLPKMPKDYIVRLVFDRRHTTVAILSDDPAVRGTDEEIVGAICVRFYHDMRFGEIAFCAVNGNQQVKVRHENGKHSYH